MIETPGSRPLLRVAVPNKGALAEAATEMLREAGYAQRNDAKELVLLDEANGVEFFYLRPRDIAVYVGEGTLDVGITGRDMLLDSGAAAAEVMPLGFGRSRFRFAAPAGADLTVEGLHDLRLATSYPGLVGGYLKERGVITRLIPLVGTQRTFLILAALVALVAALALPRTHLLVPAAIAALIALPTGPTRSPTGWRPAARCGRPGSSCSGTRSWSRRRS